MELLIDALTTEEREQLIEAVNGTPFEVEQFYITGNVILLNVPITFSEVIWGEFGTKLFDMGLEAATFHYNKIQFAINQKNWLEAFKSIPKEKKEIAFWFFKKEIPNDMIFGVFTEVYQNGDFDTDDFDEETLREMKRLNPEKFERVKNLTIYRGIGENSKSFQYSWTTDINVADFFATRIDKKGEILTCEVDGDAIIYMDKDGGPRNESEVIILPSLLKMDKLQRRSVESLKETYWTIESSNPEETYIFKVYDKRPNATLNGDALFLMPGSVSKIETTEHTLKNEGRPSTSEEIELLERALEMDLQVKRSYYLKEC